MIPRVTLLRQLDTLLRRRRWRDLDSDVAADRPPVPKPIAGGAAATVD